MWVSLINLKFSALLVFTVLIASALVSSPLNANAISPPDLPSSNLQSLLAKIHPHAISPSALHPTNGISNQATIHATSILPGDYIVTDFGDRFGNLFAVTHGGVVSTIASGVSLQGVTVNGGNYIVTDYTGNLLSVTPGGVVTTIASSGLGSSYGVAIVPTPICSRMGSGDWTVASSCIMSASDTVPANVIVNNGAVLTIPSGLKLNIDFTHHHLLVKSGGGVLIQKGGAIN